MDIALNIVKGSIVRFVLLGLVEEGEETVSVVAALEIVVDQTYEDGLALRILGESLLKILLLGLRTLGLLGDVGKLCV